MEIEMKHVIVLAIALWVAYQLPSWAKKLVPAEVGKWQVPSAIKLVLQFLIAYFLAWAGWSSIAEAIDDGLKNLRQIAEAQQILRVVKIPEMMLAIGAIVITLWLIKVIFESLGDSKTVTDSVVAIAILIALFVMYNSVWAFLRRFLFLNLEGAELLFGTEAWRIIEGFFQ